MFLSFNLTVKPFCSYLLGEFLMFYKVFVNVFKFSSCRKAILQLPFG